MITFPRTLPDEIAGGLWTFDLDPTIEVTPLRSGQQIAVNLGPALWVAHFESVDRREPALGIMRAWCNTTDPTKTFYAWDRARPYPLAYKDFSGLTVGGSPFTGSGTLQGVDTSATVVNLAALPIGFILSIGDYFAFDYGTSRALHQIVAGGVATSGVATVEVRPPIRPGWTAGAAINFHRPAAVMIVRPGTLKSSLQHHPRRGNVAFDAVQSL